MQTQDNNLEITNDQSCLSTVSGSAWIAIADKKPEIDEYVLGYRPFAGDYGDELFTVLKYRGYVNVDHLGNTHGFERLHFVSHWQRLIKPQ